MKYIIPLVFLTLFISYCSDYKVPQTKNPLQDSIKLDELQAKHKHKIMKIDFKQSEKELYKLGLRLLNEKYDFISAEKVFRHLLLNKPNNRDYKYYTAHSLFLIGEYNYYPNTLIPYKIAFSYLKELAKKYPYNTNYILIQSFAAGRLGAFLKDTKGLSSETIASFDEVKTLVEKILKIDPRHAEAKLTRGEIYCQSPGFLGGSKSQCLNHFKEIKRKHPDNMRACILLARFYRDKKQYQKAMNYFAEAAKIYKNAKKSKRTPEMYLLHITIPEHLGGIYYRQKKYKKALKSTKIHLKLRPYSASGYNQLGDCYLQLGQKSKAIKAFKKALKYKEWHRGAKRKLKQLEG